MSKQVSLYRTPAIYNVSSSGKTVNFENKTIAIGVTSPDAINENIKLAVVGDTSLQGNIDISYNLSANSATTHQITTDSISVSSDARLKENVIALNETDISINHLMPCIYTRVWDNNQQEVGFIAQEVQQHYPFLVEQQSDEMKTLSLNYNGIIGILVKEVQMLKQKVAMLEQKINHS